MKLRDRFEKYFIYLFSIIYSGNEFVGIEEMTRAETELSELLCAKAAKWEKLNIEYDEKYYSTKRLFLKIKNSDQRTGIPQNYDDPVIKETLEILESLTSTFSDLEKDALQLNYEIDTWWATTVQNVFSTLKERKAAWRKSLADKKYSHSDS